MRRTIASFLLLCCLGVPVPAAARPGWLIPKRESVTASDNQSRPWNKSHVCDPTITATLQTVAAGEQTILQWQCRYPGNFASGLLNGDNVASSGQREVYPEKTTTYAFLATNADGSTESAKVTITITPAESADSTLSAVGIGSSFSASTALSKASKSHDLKQYISSQNGTWTVIDPLMLKEKHPKAMDAWVKVLTDSGKSQPAVIWYQKTAGAIKVLSIDQLSDATTENDLLKLAKSHVPETAGVVTVRGKRYPLGLKPAPKGKKLTIGGKPVRSVSEVLSPLAEADYPVGVDLRTQFQYVKDQGNYGTCVLNATCAAYEAACFRMFGAKNSIEFSPNFLAVRTDGWNGTWAYDALDVLMNTGVVPMAAQPNYSHRLPTGWRSMASQNKALGVYGPPETNTVGYVAAALAKGYPVLVGISVGNGFEPDNDGYITYARGAGRGVNHEVVVAGGFVQHDGKRFWRMKNSWGADWGTFGDGTAYLEDKFLNDGDNDFWVIVVPSAAETYRFDSPSTSGTETIEATISAEIAPPAAATTHTMPAKDESAAVGGEKPEESAPLASPCENGQCPTGNCGERRGLFGWR